MKIATSFLATLLLASSLGASHTFAAAEDVISNSTLTPGSYCHLEFPAIRQSSLGNDQPVLKDSSTSDVIDFYGACDTDPLGQDQIQAHKLENQHRMDREYSE